MISPETATYLSICGHNVGDALARQFPPLHHPTNGPCIPFNHLDAITEGFMLVIAEAIQSWIDAGSEREAVMEAEDLHAAIHDELRSWSSNPEGSSD